MISVARFSYFLRNSGSCQRSSSTDCLVGRDLPSVGISVTLEIGNGLPSSSDTEPVIVPAVLLRTISSCAEVDISKSSREISCPPSFTSRTKQPSGIERTFTEHSGLLWQIAIAVPVIGWRPLAAGLQEVATRREILNAVLASIVCGGGGVEPVPWLPAVEVDLLEYHYEGARRRVVLFVQDATGDSRKSGFECTVPGCRLR